MVVIKENKLNESELAKTNIVFSNGKLKATIEIDVLEAIKGIDPYRAKRYGIDRVISADVIGATVKGFSEYINRLKWVAKDDDYTLVSMIADNL